MALDEQSAGAIESFRQYIEDSVATDDRYGPARREEGDDPAIWAIRFEAAMACWFEVAVCGDAPRVRVGFGTTDPDTREEITAAMAESREAMVQFVAAAFAEAGVGWRDPPVERVQAGDGVLHLATSFDLDELPDLDRPEVRGKTLRMLEGYLLAFGPAVIDEDDEGEPIEDLD
jgi:hypothetical protein